MARAVLFALATCFALFVSTSPVHAANRFGPLTPEQKRELEQRNAYSRFALGCLAGVLTLGAIGQVWFSIRNFRRVAEERRHAWAEEMRDEADDELSQGLPAPLEGDESECEEPIDVPVPRRSEPRQEPCGIVANHVYRRED
jgi:hypothetical protein